MCALLLPHPIEDQPMIDYVMNLVEWLHDIRYYARQPLLDFWTRGRSLKLQLSWEGPYKVIIWINIVVYNAQQLPQGEDDGIP